MGEVKRLTALVGRWGERGGQKGAIQFSLAHIKRQDPLSLYSSVLCEF